ncbi:MAG: metallophosphoesterase [Betaproteobacteria bacterium]|nr:metallophosphoesterase [Betaproteobacteria bacterium]
MSKHQNDEDKKPTTTQAQPLARREFLRRTAATGVGALALPAAITLPAVIAGCGGSDGSSAPTDTTPTLSSVDAALPTSAAWTFAIMGDTQWVVVNGIGDDGKNPNSCPVDIIKQLNEQFIDQKVKFVLQVGDLCDSASSATTTTIKKADGSSYSFTHLVAEDTHALFVQSLYNAGIGLFTLRGNHDDAVAEEFQRIFPQTQNGKHNATPSDIFSTPNPDADLQPAVAKSGGEFTIGSNFSSPSDNLKGLSYAFDYGNARFVLLDQFTTADKKNADDTAYSLNTAIAAQQPWIDQVLSSRPSGSHALVFSHKGLVTENHLDVLFGDCPAPGAVTVGGKNYVGSPGMDAFITSLNKNGVRYYICGHDHMHDRSRIATMDGSAHVSQIVCSSNSNKFYYPVTPANDTAYSQGKRQTLLAQELNTIGYYLVTVDGPTMLIDFYSAPAYPTPVNEGNITTTPKLNFSLRERVVYGLNGHEFIIAPMASFTGIADTSPNGHAMKILDGSNGSSAVDVSGRWFNMAVNTAWLAATSATASDILLLQGMAWTMGSRKTDPYVLSLSFDPAKNSSVSGRSIMLASVGTDGKWVNAVACNSSSGRSGDFVHGPWQAGYPLGTCGIDSSTNTVWAVLDYNGYFAAVELPA